MQRFFHWICKTGIWAPVTVLVFHEFVSIKEWRTQIDWINHFSGGLAFSYFAWKNIPSLTPWTGTPSSFGRLGCAFLAGCTAALLWEIGEFASDLYLGTSIQKTIYETMMDLVNGLLGTIATVTVLCFHVTRTSRKAKP